MIRIAARTRRAASAQSSTAIAKAALLAALCMSALLAGCGGVRVEPDAPGGVNLAGSWRLNRQASGDPDALITAIVEKEMKHMRRRTRPDDDDPEEMPPPSGGGVSTGGRGRNAGRAESVEPPNGMFRPRGGMAAYLRSQYTNALGSILGGEGLVIEQAPDRFVLTRGDSRRTFTPGGHSVVGVADGVADQNSGWNGHEYVIDVRPQVGPRVTERYALASNGQLIEKVSLSGDGLPKLDFTRVYDKGAPPPRVLPGS